MEPAAFAAEMMMVRKDKVDYRAAECCFHCAGFLRPDAPGVVNGQCVKVIGSVHPGSTCDLFEFAIDDDGDDDGRPDDREHINPSASSERDGHLRPQLCDGHERGRFLSTSETYG